MTPPTGRPTVPMRIVFRAVDGAGSGGLGEPVALVDRDADAAEEVAQPAAERRAAGYGRDAVAAERGAQLAVDELDRRAVCCTRSVSGIRPDSSASE